MIASPVGPATASRRRALVLAALALLAACAGPREIRGVGTRLARQPLLRPAEGRPVVLLLDLEVLELGSAVLPTPRAAWTRAAEAEVMGALQQLADAHRIGLVPFDRERASEEAQRLAARLRAALLVPLRPGPGSTMFPRTTLPEYGESRELRVPEVGAVSRPLGQLSGVDHALYVLLRESRGTPGLAESQRQRAELARAATAHLVAFHPGVFGYAVLVELPTGVALMERTVMSVRGGPSLADSAGTEAVLRALFQEP